MHALESLDVVKDMLRALMERPEPFVKELPPAPGSRAERYMQLFCPDLHPIDAPAAAMPSASGGSTAQPRPDGSAGLAERVARLEGEVESLRQLVTRLATALGEPTER
jgi:uncharacterized protein YceH (UPF0502 family)